MKIKAAAATILTITVGGAISLLPTLTRTVSLWMPGPKAAATVTAPQQQQQPLHMATAAITTILQTTILTDPP